MGILDSLRSAAAWLSGPDDAPVVWTSWANHREYEAGLPVFKRAKHGIHFLRSDGQIEAHFSGRPCHYQDTDGLWKPIDTKLLATADGWYGAPHSKVQIHPDGRVRVTGTDYQQYTELPGAPTGKVDNNRIVRDFLFGTQSLYLTEDGFHHELLISGMPTVEEAKKLIATESGTLSLEYLKSLTTAVDANGDIHTFSTLTAFRTWLASAAFPVVIDPDFSIGNTTYGDTWLAEATGSPNYNEQRNYGAATTSMILSTAYFLMRYDLSTIDSSSICSGVTLKLTKTKTAVNRNSTIKIFSLSAGNADWIEGTSNGSTTTPLAGEPCLAARKADGSGGVAEAWASGGHFNSTPDDYESTELMSQTINTNSGVGTQYSFDFTAAGVARVEDWFGGITNNYGFVIRSSIIYDDLTVATGENATESYRPVLTVLYTGAETESERRTQLFRLRRKTRWF